MTDANAQAFKPNSLVGLTIYNNTDGSDGVITANTANTITVAALAGGGLNIWTTGDEYHVTDPVGNTPYQLVIDTPLDVQVVGDPGYDIVVDPGITVNFMGDLVCRGLANTTGTVIIHGKLEAHGLIQNTDTGTITIHDDCVGSLGMDNTSTGTIEVLGNLYIQGGNIQNTDPGGGGSITVWGDVECGWELNNHGNFGSFGDIHVNYLENAGPGQRRC